MRKKIYYKNVSLRLMFKMVLKDRAYLDLIKNLASSINPQQLISSHNNKASLMLIKRVKNKMMKMEMLKRKTLIVVALLRLQT